MKRPAQVLLLVLCGLGLLHVSLFTDLSLRYVKEGLRPLLVVSGVLLLALGLLDAASGLGRGRRSGRSDSGGRSDSSDHGGHDEHATDGDHATDNERTTDGEHGSQGREGHGHDHSATPRVAWLLFLPALSLLLFAPPALGAYTAARQAPTVVKEQQRFDPLPRTSPVPMTLTGFTTRVRQDHAGDIRGRVIRMTGFVTPDKRGGGWQLTRIIFSCCAADAQTVLVRVHGRPAPAADTWVAVTGTWHPGGTLGTSSAPAALDARTVERITRPVNAYTDDLPLNPTR
ncbi:TIGR03943 family putative permease subunit [Streptomyces sp. NPDC096198]|uniref:TIGR03943 family putative permease subunit n=1 Tax=Streptomyces sp. NPDC096198 TaxID=3366080 RepID=UPI0038033FD3